MLTTETGEVIIALPESQMDFNSEDFDPSKVLFKTGEKLKGDFTLSFSKLKQLQSNFISQVACGKEHAALLTQSGFVYSFGHNQFSQLGHQSVKKDAYQPLPQILFPLLNLKVSEISCGDNHTVVMGTSRDTAT